MVRPIGGKRDGAPSVASAMVVSAGATPSATSVMVGRARQAWRWAACGKRGGRVRRRDARKTPRATSVMLCPIGGKRDGAPSVASVMVVSAGVTRAGPSATSVMVRRASAVSVMVVYGGECAERDGMPARTRQARWCGAPSVARVMVVPAGGTRKNAERDKRDGAPSRVWQA